MTNTILSNHGEKRIRERCGKSSDKIASNAIDRGIRRELTTGRLFEYLYARYKYSGSEPNIYVYQNKVFIFDGFILVTVLDLPTNLHKQAEAQIRKYQDKIKEVKH